MSGSALGGTLFCIQRGSPVIRLISASFAFRACSAAHHWRLRYSSLDAMSFLRGGYLLNVHHLDVAVCLSERHSANPIRLSLSANPVASSALSASIQTSASSITVWANLTL